MLPDGWLELLTTTTAGLFFFLFLVKRVTPASLRAEPVGALGASRAPEDRPVPSRLPPMRELIPPVDPHLLDEADQRPGPLPEELGVPRWLRPSVREARFHGSRDPRTDRWE